MYTGRGMFNTGIAMTASLFFGIIGIGTMMDLVMVMGRATHTVTIRTMISTMAMTTTIIDQK
jgi:hypothetical protein